MIKILDMRDILSPILAIIFIQLFSQVSYAENNDSLSANLQKFSTYQNENYKEKIYVRLDKDFYLAGEFLRFSISCLDAKTLDYSKLSKVAYLELLDTGRAAVLQTKIVLNEGRGFGEIFIPSNFESGNYLLRSYTSWMKNYRTELFYHTVVHVINPFKRPALGPKPRSDEMDIQFFPEGVSLVKGIRSKIAFKVNNKYGKGIHCIGKIIDDLGNEVLEFNPKNNGIGTFYLRPEDQRSYHAVFILEDSTIINSRLPDIMDEGYALKINNLDPDQIIAEVTSSQPSSSEALLLVGHSNAKLLFTEPIYMNNGNGKVILEKEFLDPGIMRITLFDHRARIVGERSVFVHPETQINLQLDTDKKLYQNREKVTLRIRTSDEKSGPVRSGLSVSIWSYDKYFDQFSQNIETYFLLSGETSFNQELIDTYIKGKSVADRQAMDDLILTLSYRDFLWDDLSNELDQKAFIPEIRDHIITGRITYNKSEVGVPGISGYLSIPSKNVQFYAAKSQENGKIYFEMNDFYGKNEIITQTENFSDTLYQIRIDNPFTEEYSDFYIPLFDINPEIQSFIEKSSTSMQIQNSYRKYTPAENPVSQFVPTSFYHSFSRYYLDDYTRFPVMEEVMREYITGVYLRRNRDGFYFRILDDGRNETYQESPLILFDGVPVFDADDVMVLDPLNIERIETVRRRYLKGVFNFKGIVSFITYEGDLDGLQANKNASIIEYEGVQHTKEYATPEYDMLEGRNNRIPDFRNVLYWNPQFETNENGEAVLEFYTSDDISKYAIRVEGISNDGRPISGQTFIQVIDDKD